MLFYYWQENNSAEILANISNIIPRKSVMDRSFNSSILILAHRFLSSLCVSALSLISVYLEHVLFSPEVPRNSNSAFYFFQYKCFFFFFLDKRWGKGYNYQYITQFVCISSYLWILLKSSCIIFALNHYWAFCVLWILTFGQMYNVQLILCQLDMS